MRWIVTLVALAAGIAWLNNRRRRAQVQDTLRTTVPTDLQARVKETASSLGETARSAASTATEKAQQFAQEIAQRGRATVGDAAANAQDAAGAVTDRVQQATETDEEATSNGAGAMQTDLDTPPPSVHDTVQAELADVSEQVDSLRSQAEAPPESTAPAGQRPRPVSGQGTTTATGEAVNPLSSVTAGQTSTGTAEPLPEGLTPGEPGTGGPQGSTQAPTVPGSTETPTIGMEPPPDIDRASEVAERTSGDFIGNKNTRIFHAATANNLPAESNRIYFQTEEEALAAGFRPAENEELESAGS